MGDMATQFDPASGTRDLLADDVAKRERAFDVIRRVFAGYGFEPLQTPAFERLDVLMGKYGEDGDKLVFKILRRGEHEASGEADLALRYDHTVPLARVAAAYGSRLPSPYKRYVLGPVWRAERPGKDRYREFVQCDLDTLGSGVLITLDKLDKLSPAAVVAELTGRGLAEGTAGELVTAMTAPDATERIRAALQKSEEGAAGLDDVDNVLSLVSLQVPAGRVRFTPRLVRGLSYYTGPIWELTAPGVAGSMGGGGRYDHLIAQLGGPDVPATGTSLGVERILSLLPDDGAGQRGRLDVAVTVMGEELAAASFDFAATARGAGLRASVYLGSSGKLGRQLKWASDQGARWCLIYGSTEAEAGTVTVRDLRSGQQEAVPIGDLGANLSVRAAAEQGRQ